MAVLFFRSYTKKEQQIWDARAGDDGFSLGCIDFKCLWAEKWERHPISSWIILV